MTALPALDGSAPSTGIDRATPAVVFGPDDSTLVGVDGRRFSVIDVAAGVVTTLVEQRDGRHYGAGPASPDGRSAVIWESGDGEATIGLCDLARAKTVPLVDTLGAAYSPDSTLVLTHPLGEDEPIAIRTLDGELIGDVAGHDAAW